MPFDFKNARSIYQRMEIRMFKSQIGRNVEAYIDVMVIKSKHVVKHLSNLGEVFSMLRERGLCLNASKCSFVLARQIF